MIAIFGGCTSWPGTVGVDILHYSSTPHDDDISVCRSPITLALYFCEFFSLRFLRRIAIDGDTVFPIYFVSWRWSSIMTQRTGTKKNLLDNIYGHKFNYYCIKLCLRLTSIRKCCVTQFEGPFCSHNAEAMITVLSHHKEIIQWMDDFFVADIRLLFYVPTCGTFRLTRIWTTTCNAQKGEVADPFFSVNRNVPVERMSFDCQWNRIWTN